MDDADKARLFASHQYRQRGILGVKTFYKEKEGENFYIQDGPTGKKITVYPSSKTHFEGYDEKVTIDKSGETDNLMSKASSYLAAVGSGYAVYKRYSQIVYDGDDLNVFGYISYNKYTDSWELTKPLAFIKKGCEEAYTNTLGSEKMWEGVKFVGNVAIFGIASFLALKLLKATFYCISQ